MKTKALFVTLALAAASATSHGAALSYNLFQDGYSEGAVITGMFTAEDLDMNGQISSFEGELSSFMIEFSGNSIIPAFTADLTDDFIGFVWDLDPILGDGFAGDTEGIGITSSSGVNYVVPNGLISFPPAGRLTVFTGAQDETLNFVQVRPKRGTGVPSGGTTAVMLGMGVGMLGLSKRLVRR